jgi:ABC-type microcin C transport system duplicated ATPase subunit YejF
LNGQNLFELNSSQLQASRQKLQIIFQNPFGSLNPRMRVKEILEEKGDLIRLQSLYDQKTKVMANIRKQLLRVSDPNNDSMTGAEKKEEIERLKSLISDQAKQAEDIRKSFKK